jgi:DnaJ-class molecular chaperone
VEKGPNHYQLLNIRRDSTLSQLKKSYRTLSLELHPDKNKSPNAEQEFHRVKLAYDTISNADMKRAYNLLGDTGAKVAVKGSVDLKYIAVQMMVYYGSSLIIAFLMTFSEASGEALTTSLFGLSGIDNFFLQ